MRMSSDRPKSKSVQMTKKMILALMMENMTSLMRVSMWTWKKISSDNSMVMTILKDWWLTWTWKKSWSEILAETLMITLTLSSLSIYRKNWFMSSEVTDSLKTLSKIWTLRSSWSETSEGPEMETNILKQSFLTISKRSSFETSTETGILKIWSKTTISRNSWSETSAEIMTT